VIPKQKFKEFDQKYKRLLHLRNEAFPADRDQVKSWREWLGDCVESLRAKLRGTGQKRQEVVKVLLLDNVSEEDLTTAGDSVRE
jgi:hypothetical protein